MKHFLVVVDIQNDFVDGALGTKEAVNIIKNCTKRINEFEGDIYVTFDTHFEDYMETSEGKKLPVVHCVRNTPGWEIDADVFAAGEGKTVAIIDKPTFGSEELCNFAAAGGYDGIELIGLCTDICVISNALCLKAALWETPIAVARDCCAGVTPASHENALSAMTMCQIDII